VLFPHFHKGSRRIARDTVLGAGAVTPPPPLRTSRRIAQRRGLIPCASAQAHDSSQSCAPDASHSAGSYTMCERAGARLARTRAHAASACAHTTSGARSCSPSSHSLVLRACTAARSDGVVCRVQDRSGGNVWNLTSATMTIA